MKLSFRMLLLFSVKRKTLCQAPITNYLQLELISLIDAHRERGRGISSEKLSHKNAIKHEKRRKKWTP
jgi:hypothetical protein